MAIRNLKDYAIGSPERSELSATLKSLRNRLPQKIPVIVNGTQINTNLSSKQINPSKHAEVVAEYASATPKDVNAAIDAALKAKPAWEALPFEDRAAVFLRASELVATKYRSELVAATMIGQGKNIWQAEIDAAAETCDFFRYYVQECWSLFSQQPKVHLPGTWNKLEYRPLEGFVYAIAPFNFTALGATLIGPAALLGNVVIWKPSPFALHSAWLLHKILLEAGLPRDVIQFVPGNAEEITDTVLKRREFAGVSYIGSTAVFKGLQQKIGTGIGEGRYASYPRIVGETGGKNWTVVHPSADIDSAVNNTIRSAFEYQGQKCSALSRLYVARSIWPKFRQRLKTKIEKHLKVGDPLNDFSNFINPVIHETAFDRLQATIDSAEQDPELELIVGGHASKEIGYYVHPTVYQTTNPHHDIMARELFGPILAVYVYDDDTGTTSTTSTTSGAATTTASHEIPPWWTQLLTLINTTSTYALTGSIFSLDPYATRYAIDGPLKHAAGMLYVNTKCTGSVVAQQPFGGGRDSGTNDKTGTMAHLLRWVSARTVKEEFGAGLGRKSGGEVEEGEGREGRAEEEDKGQGVLYPSNMV